MKEQTDSATVFVMFCTRQIEKKESAGVTSYDTLTQGCVSRARREAALSVVAVLIIPSVSAPRTRSSISTALDI